MFNANQLEMELKIRELTYIDEPSPLYVHTHWLKMKKQNPQLRRISDPKVIHWRPVWIILLAMVIVLSALFIGFGPQKVYGFIRQIFGFSDSGLQAVQEAGLVTDLNITAQPTVITLGGTESDLEKDAFQVSLSQVIEGMTVTLDWAYVDESRLVLGFTTESIPPELTFQLPEITFVSFTPNMNAYSRSMAIGNDQVLYTAYQVIQVDIAGEQIDFSVDLPLVKTEDVSGERLATFHFDLQGIPVYRGMTVALQQTASVTINNVEVQLRSVRITPSFTNLEICYDFPPGNEDARYMPDATLQFGDRPFERDFVFQKISVDNDKKEVCADLGFTIGNTENAEQLVFRVHSLYIPLPDQVSANRIYDANQVLSQYGIEIAPAIEGQNDGPGGWMFTRQPENVSSGEDPYWLVLDTLREKMTGPWTFYVDIPTSADFNPDEQIVTDAVTSPVDSQTLSDVTVTLDWVFVDALRAGVGYTVSGLPDVPEAGGLQGEILLYDAQGNAIGGSGVGSTSINRVEDQPGVLQGTWSVGFLEPLMDPEASFTLEITLGSSNSEMRYYIAGFPVSPEATPYPPGEFPPDLPERLIGTYTFDFTAPVHPLTVINQTTPVTVNGIQFLVPRAEVTASTSKVMVCYQKPTERDWWIMDASVRNGEKEERMGGGGVLYDADFQLKPSTLVDLSKWEIPESFLTVEHGRCLLLDFLQGQGNPDESLILTVESIDISPPEIYPEAELAVAHEILQAEGIEFNFEVYRGVGGGGGGINFTTLPEGMTWETAYQKFMEALGYVHTGPWEITIIGQP